MQQICKKSSSMKRMVYLVACLPFWLTSCEEKVTALHFNEAEQVFEIGKESELRFLNETFEIKDKNMEAQTLLTDAGKEIPADEVRIKLVKDIEISGEWTPIKFPVREFDGNGHTITFDGIRVVIEESSKGVFDVGLFEEMGGEKEAVVKDLTLAGDKREKTVIACLPVLWRESSRMDVSRIVPARWISHSLTIRVSVHSVWVDLSETWIATAPKWKWLCVAR